MFKTNIDDTIVAISTATGQGGIGIVRLSGQDSLRIADRMFESKGKKKPSEFKSFTVHYGWVVNRSKTKATGSKSQVTGHKSNGIIDEALLTVMRAPKSYTREDVVEISLHGGIIPLRATLSLALDLGARLAEPGEFTKRAFLNGRIDLAQAEAVLDIIRSKTDAFLKVSTNQLKGDLTIELEIIRDTLMNIYTEIEAIINFPEDDIDAVNRTQLLKNTKKALGCVEKLLESSEHGRILKEGIKVVICGKPNVGKSSLLNVLLKQPRAIVTEVAGTTRDTIEETTQIKGIPFQLVDTAGILEPRDLIEKEAVKRSRMYIKSADLILLVLDVSHQISKQDDVLIKKVKGKNVFVILNKIDLTFKIDKEEIRKRLKASSMLQVSALKKKGIKKLEEAIIENVWHGKVVDTQEILISNIRHIQSLKGCRSAIKKVKETLSGQLPLELVAEEGKLAINHLDAITGRNIDRDLLDKIFSDFCIGK